jgi:hypothetical protein
VCLQQMVGVTAGATHGFCRCRLWVFIASIAGTVIIVGVHGMVCFASDVGIHVWCLRFSPRFPHQDRRSVTGLVQLELKEYGRFLSLIGVAGCLGWV